VRTYAHDCDTIATPLVGELVVNCLTASGGIELPREAVELMGRRVAADRDWFEAHPGRSSFVRPGVRGEDPTQPDRAPLLVRVTKISEVARIREVLS
jgi:hypothetical protein